MNPKNILRLRKDLGDISQQQLADMIGTQRHTISRWETGENRPRGATLKALKDLQEKIKKKKK